MNRLNISRVALLLSLLLPVIGLPADEDIAWIADANGCKVANPFPQTGETITWSGVCKNKLANGEGMLVWTVNGKIADRYEGSLVMGWAEGKGTLTREEGRYSGDWKHSLQDGNGRFDAADGSWYEGQWKNGQPHGQGRYRSADGKLLEGEWMDGEFQGDLGGDDNPNRI